MIRIALVEDDKQMTLELIEVTQRFFKENNVKSEIYTFANAEDFLCDFKNNYNLILMDIDLPNMDGMNAVQHLRETKSDTMVIFVTSLAQYAIEGYKVNAFDFVVKPVQYYNFALTLKRALKSLLVQSEKSIIINNKSFMQKIDISNLKYIEVINHNLVFHTVNNNIEIRGTLSTYVHQLKDYDFVLCNRCYLVNLKFVSRVTTEYVIIGEEKLILSKSRRTDFISAINAFISRGGESIKRLQN